MSESNVLAEVGISLVSHRTRLGLDIELAATLAHLDPERLAEAEAGETALDERDLAGLADAYGVDVTAFFGGRTTPLSYLAGA